MTAGPSIHYRPRADGWWLVLLDRQVIGSARRVRSGFDPVWEARDPDGAPVYRPGRGIHSRAEAADVLIEAADRAAGTVTRKEAASIMAEHLMTTGGDFMDAVAAALTAERRKAVKSG